MIIFRGWSNKPDRTMLATLMEESGFLIEFRGGDVCDPFGGTWFDPDRLPRYVWRTFFKRACLPWISWRLGPAGGHIGFKAYGADSEDYKHWMNRDDVHAGSQALCFSIRPFASVNA